MDYDNKLIMVWISILDYDGDAWMWLLYIWFTLIVFSGWSYIYGYLFFCFRVFQDKGWLTRQMHILVFLNLTEI